MSKGSKKKWRIEFYYGDSYKQLCAEEISITPVMTEVEFRKHLKKELDKRKPQMWRVTTKGFFL
jgi:hypothetical protein